MTAVEFGLYLPMTSRGMAPGALVSELVEEVLEAERVGFSVALVPEHHDGPQGSLTAPVAFTAWLLACTSRIRVGPGVLLLPLYHPMHVAEWSELVQHASGKRLVLGIGTGYQQPDFEAFDLEWADRVELFDRGFSRLMQRWHPQVGDPMPVPDGVPPVWVGAWSRPGVRRAARYGDAWLVDPLRTLTEIEHMAQIYRTTAADAGRGGEIVVIRELWVDQTDSLARTRYRPYVDPVLRYYQRNGALDPDKSLDDLADEIVLCGSPDTLTEQLVELVERTGATTIVFTLRHPAGPTHVEVLTAINVLGNQILPAVRAATAIATRHERAT